MLKVNQASHVCRYHCSGLIIEVFETIADASQYSYGARTGLLLSDA